MSNNYQSSLGLIYALDADLPRFSEILNLAETESKSSLRRLLASRWSYFSMPNPEMKSYSQLISKRDLVFSDIMASINSDSFIYLFLWMEVNFLTVRREIHKARKKANSTFEDLYVNISKKDIDLSVFGDSFSENWEKIVDLNTVELELFLDFLRIKKLNSYYRRGTEIEKKYINILVDEYEANLTHRLEKDSKYRQFANELYISESRHTIEVEDEKNPTNINYVKMFYEERIALLNKALYSGDSSASLLHFINKIDSITRNISSILFLSRSDWKDQVVDYDWIKT